MSRAALGLAIGLVALAQTTVIRAIDPHVDSTLLLQGCEACHRGHGVPRSPMLPAPQSEVCLECHDSLVKSNQAVVRGALSSGAGPRLLSAALSQPFVHPMDERAYSSYEAGSVTCTSCHSPHRGMAASRFGETSVGIRKTSTKDPTRFEYELCESCHGGRGVATQSLLDVSRLLNPNNRSYHPVEGPSGASSPSVLPSLAGKEINCTDCHGNSDPTGPAGPHGSAVRFILSAEYTTLDGGAESSSAFALCYGCHDRDKVLDGSPFPEHRMHVVDERASCATCHNPHGSVENRSLIRFGEETTLAGVAPSGLADRLGFESTGPGSGACYVSCHGHDHAPAVYGGLQPEPIPSRALRSPGTRPTRPGPGRRR